VFRYSEPMANRPDKDRMVHAPRSCCPCRLLLALGIVAAILTCRCAPVTHTEVHFVDPQLRQGAKRIGILSFEASTIRPQTTADQAAMLFGLVGALVATALKPDDNASDETCDEVAVGFYQGARELLENGLRHSAAWKYVAAPSQASSDSAALAMGLREHRFWAAHPPPTPAIAAFASRNGLDYVLWVYASGGRVRAQDQALSVDTSWRIFGADGSEVARIHTLVTDETRGTPQPLDRQGIKEKLVAMFGDSRARFFDALDRPPARARHVSDSPGNPRSPYFDPVWGKADD
jgi:hypothetical protein